MVDSAKNIIRKILAIVGIGHPAAGVKISQERKAEILLENKRGLKVLVETGTFEGGMLEAIGAQFKLVYSIELDESLHERNTEKFKDMNNVKLLRGNSGFLIKDILEEINEPALFWLDAHGSGSITAENSPIIKELDAIFSHPIKSHMIIIDDARHFDFSTMRKMNDMACRNHRLFKVREGIFFLPPKL